MTFLQHLESTIQKNNSLLCVGLDPDHSKFPKGVTDIFEFNKKIIDETHDLVCCYKPNVGFYAEFGTVGIQALQKTIEHAHSYSIPVLLDAKRGDLGNTAEHYVKEAFDVFNADAVTVNPYMGFDSVEPFLRHTDKGIVILCRTSNPSAADFQDLNVILANEVRPESDKSRQEDPGHTPPSTGARMIPLYLHVAQKVVEWDTQYKNCLMVVGATWPEQLKEVRSVAPSMFFLIPGIGAQGGDLEGTLQNGLRKDKSGLIITSSRGILYAENPRQAAQELRDEINKYR